MDTGRYVGCKDAVSGGDCVDVWGVVAGVVLRGDGGVREAEV